jgi:hypothetical protein
MSHSDPKNPIQLLRWPEGRYLLISLLSSFFNKKISAKFKSTTERYA